MNYEESFLSIDRIPPPITLPSESYFKLYSVVDDVLYLAGHGLSWGNDFSHNLGKVGFDLSIEQGIEAARVCMLNLLQTTRIAILSLNNVDSVIEVFGIVNCMQDFKEHSKVLNGASKMLYDLFGESGKHARIVIGANSLPFDFSVEIKMILKIKGNGK